MVGFVNMAVQWAIPDIPRKLRDQIKREAFLTSEIILRQEAFKAKGIQLFNSTQTEIFIKIIVVLGVKDVESPACSHNILNTDCTHCNNDNAEENLRRRKNGSIDSFKDVDETGV